MFDENRIAIIIPLYNDASHIGRAIESAARSEIPDGFYLDVIVVDDCSTDDSYEVASAAAAPFETVRVLQVERNGGPSAARNYGLTHSRALWFTPLDSDDIVAESRLRHLLEQALARDLDLIADNLIVSDSDSPTRAIRSLWPDKPDGVVPLTAELFLSKSVNMPEPRTELGYLKPLIRRTALADRAERPYRDQIRFGEDYELYAHMLVNGARAELIDAAGYYFVQRGGSASRSADAGQHFIMADVDRTLLQNRNLSDATRSAIKDHLAYSVREWTSWQFIEAARRRHPGPVLRAFLHQPAQSTRHLWQAMTRRLGLGSAATRASGPEPGRDS